MTSQLQKKKTSKDIGVPIIKYLHYLALAYDNNVT